MTEGEACTFSTRAQISLIFQDGYRVFCLSCNIVSHFSPHACFFDKFRCISAVETMMPWCKRSKNDDVTEHLNVG